MNDILTEIYPDIKTGPTAAELLKQAWVDTSLQFEEPPTILSIKEQQGSQWVYRRILSLANFSAIKGKKKARKTTLLAYICGQLLCRSSERMVAARPKDRPGVLYFDTEQSLFDSWRIYRMIERISGSLEHFRGYNLRPLSPLQRCEVIEEALRQYGHETCFVAVDGVRDLVTAINDELEATRVSGLFLRWTAEYNCHLSTVIHENKLTKDSRGHIGTEIENKAEIILTASLHPQNWRMSDIECTVSRSIPFEPFVLAVDDDGIPAIEGDVKPTLVAQNEYQIPDTDDDDAPF